MGAPFIRDMDLIRRLLLEIESGRRAFEIVGDDVADLLGIDKSATMAVAEADQLEYHLELLASAGFIELERTNIVWRIRTLTWTGHEFLDSVRDGDVWKHAKAGAKKAGNQSIAFTWELAKAYAKHLAGERLGITLP